MHPEEEQDEEMHQYRSRRKRYIRIGAGGRYASGMGLEGRDASGRGAGGRDTPRREAGGRDGSGTETEGIVLSGR